MTLSWPRSCLELGTSRGLDRITGSRPRRILGDRQVICVPSLEGPGCRENSSKCRNCAKVTVRARRAPARGQWADFQLSKVIPVNIPVPPDSIQSENPRGSEELEIGRICRITPLVIISAAAPADRGLGGDCPVHAAGSDATRPGVSLDTAKRTSETNDHQKRRNRDFRRRGSNCREQAETYRESNVFPVSPFQHRTKVRTDG
jgi:hypothetical protein